MSDTDKYTYSCSTGGLKCAECGRSDLTSVTYIDGRPVCSICVSRMFPVVTTTAATGEVAAYYHVECPDCKRLQADLTAANACADEAEAMCEWLAKLAGDAMCQSLRCDDCPCFGECRAKNETVCIAALLAAAREAGTHHE